VGHAGASKVVTAAAVILSTHIARGDYLSPWHGRQLLAARVIHLTSRLDSQSISSAPRHADRVWHAYCCLSSQVVLLTDSTMALNLDTYLGVDAAALKLQSQRMEVLANNLANVDTPNYKARDIDFKAALAQAGSPGATLPLSTTAPGQIGAAAGADATASGALRYRVPLAPSLDGNTVDAQLEQAAFADNTVRYQATLTFLSAKLKGLMTAITGQ
jgi:flagellar basal-body rod protein FlgB